MIHEQSYHFHVIRRALDLIDGAEGTLSLQDLSAAMEMSPAHFQRLFSAWVGVSPKRYQQYLQLGHAKALLADRFTTLDAAQLSGLSGTGRLHDLFLRWDAMSPGEYARQGDGLVIRYGTYDSPFGPALVMATDKGPGKMHNTTIQKLAQQLGVTDNMKYAYAQNTGLQKGTLTITYYPNEE